MHITKLSKKCMNFCKNFDKGEIYYAKDIANHLFMMLCEDGQASILQQLGLKSKIRLYSTIPENIG